VPPSQSLSRVAAVVLGLSLALVLVAPARAAVGIPKQVPYTGYLKDNATGGAAPDGTYAMVFKIYDAATSGTLLWSESQGGVSMTKGTFAVMLGSVTPFGSSIDFNTDNGYLTMTVNGGSEMSPRQRLAAAPYAMNADTTDGVHLTSGTAGYLPKYGTAGTYIGGNSAVYDDGAGKIGIGTTSPSAKLHVNGTGYFTGDTSIGNTTISTGSFPGIALFNKAKISTDWNGSFGGKLLFATAEPSAGTMTDRVTIDPNGNVGIGTTVPASLLDIQTSTTSNRTIGFGVFTNTAAGPIIAFQKSRGTTPGTQTIVYQGDTLGILNFLGSDGTSFTSGASIRAIIEAPYAVSVGDIPTRLAFFTTPGGSVTQVERLRIDNQGNIGIGTTTPSGKLSVTPLQYSTGTASQSTTTVTGVGTTWTTAMVGSQFVFASGFSAGTITAFGSATSLTVSTSQTVASQAYTISYTGLQVSSTGNVGIGTTGPNNSLHVAGDVRFSAADPSLSLGKLLLGGTTDIVGIYRSAPNNLVSGANSLNLGSYADMYFLTGAANLGSQTVRMTIQQAGNVGIGTATPAGKFEVNGGGVGVSVGDFVVDTTNKTVFVGRQSSTDSDNSIFAVRDRVGTNKLYVSAGAGVSSYFSSGNVGIGTTAPGAKLDVSGPVGENVKVTFTSPIVLTAGQVLGGYAFGYKSADYGADLVTGRIDSINYFQGGTGSGWFGFSARYSAGISFSTISAGTLTEKMRISDTGNVGIGTTNPGATLHVNSGWAGSITTLSAAFTSSQFKVTDTANPTVGLHIGLTSGYNPYIQGAASASATTSLYLQPFGGNVGIGTTAPGGRLEVWVGAESTNPAVTSPLSLRLRSGSPTPLNVMGGVEFISWDNDRKSAIYGIRRDDGDAGRSGDLRFYTKNSSDAFGERLRIEPSGNVGIGTTAPSQALEVNGGARFNTATTKPTCNSAARGTFWVTQGSTGVKDSAELCAKDAAEAYAWRVLY